MPIPFDSQEAGGDWSHGALEPLVGLLKQAVVDGRFSPDQILPMSLHSSAELFTAARERWQGTS